MENKEAWVNELSRYQTNFKYMTESGLLYPNIDLKNRKRIVQIYNEVFDKKERISTTCQSCVKKYVKELAGWYYAASESPQPEQEIPDIEQEAVHNEALPKATTAKRKSSKKKSNESE